ncbi:MAG: putative arabinose efflux permease, MFS family [Chloroflexi bacterium]|jgi:DHA1 family inner membrane transport protein|nr:MAG: putative arabinose efflux permease, MFS family [Chloroflexota bacterium]
MRSKNKTAPGFLFLVATAGSGIFIIQLVIFMMGPLLVDIADDLGVEVPVAGQLNTVTAGVWLFVAGSAGYFSDRYGRKPILLIGLVATIVGVLGMGVAWTFPVAMLFRAVSGLGGLIPPTFSAFLADYVPASSRGKAFGWMSATGGLAIVVGVPLTTLVGELVGWRWSFVAAAAATALVGLFVFLRLPNPAPVGNSGGILTRFAPLARVGLIWDMSLVNMTHRIAYFGFSTYFAAYLIVSHDLSTGQTAIPVAIIGVGTVVSPAVVGYMADSRHRSKVMPVGLAISGVIAYLIFGVDLPLLLVVALGLLFTVAIFAPFTMFHTFLSLIGGRRLQGTAMNVPAFSNQSGAMFGPALGGLALAIGGYGAIGLLCMVVAVFGSVVAAARVRDDRIRAATERIARLDPQGNTDNR